MIRDYSRFAWVFPVRKIAAWSVHLYTASSAVVGLWAIVAIFEGEYRLAIFLQMLALAIDSTDGMLARAVDVRGQIPWFDGRRLDDICDFFTYVLVPACMMIEADLLPHPAWAAAPVLASAYGFSRDDAKTEDHFFTGFPSYWNVVAMYFYLLRMEPQTALWITLLLAAAVFVPIKYIYPSRTRTFRPLSLAVFAAWMLFFCWVGVQPEPDPVQVRLSLLGPAYYLGLSLLLNLWKPPRQASGDPLEISD
jgi:phosphatidylcholine synthase